MPENPSALPVGRAGLLSVKLPPLNLLRTFESAAWHSSFTLAAEELNVTQSAVSQQIRQLEEFLGMRLFQRLPRHLQLTPEGAIFANSIREALAMMGRACVRLKDPQTPSNLNISVFPSFGSRWLSRRISGFVDRNPQLRVTLTTSKETVQFQRQTTDVAVRWGNGNWSGVSSRSLGKQPIFPVCSPSHLASSPPIRKARDLLGHRLLQTIEGAHWPAWFEAAGEQGVTLHQSLHFGDAAMMLEACLEGQGIALSTYFLIEDDLRAGRLVRAFDLGIQIGEGFYLLWSGTGVPKPSVTLFQDWLIEMTEASMADSVHWAGTIA